MEHGSEAPDVPVIDLSAAPGKREAWDQPTWKVYAWAACEVLVLRNPLQPSSGLRARALRAFGAHIGEGVLLRPGLRVKFPWKLTSGTGPGSGGRLAAQPGRTQHRLRRRRVPADLHHHRHPPLPRRHALTTRPVVIEDGAWITARCTVLAGSHIGRSALVLPATVVDGDVPANSLYGSNRAGVVGQRFPDAAPTTEPEDNPSDAAVTT